MQELKNSPYGISERMTASIFSYGSSEDKLWYELAWTKNRVQWSYSVVTIFEVLIPWSRSFLMSNQTASVMKPEK
jgi:hypothetical protein